MRFSVDANIIIKKIIPSISGGLSKDKYSILANYHVGIADNVLSVTSSNEVVQINITAPVISDDKCEFLARPDLFDRLKVLNGEIVFDLKDNLLTIKNGSYKTTAKILPSDNYPIDSLDDYKTIGTFESDCLLELIKTNIATSKEDEQTREFNGVLVEIDDKKINFVATNRSRLFWINKPIDNNTNFYCIVEKEGIIQLNRILKSNEKVNILYKGEGDNVLKVAFQTDNATVISKVINGRFPQYQAVLMENAQNVSFIIFDKELLKKSLQKVIALSNDELSTVEFNIQDTNLTLNVTNKEGELASDIVEFTIDQDKNFTPIVFNANGRYAMDFLNNIQANTVYFYYKEPIKPLELKAIGDNQISYVYVMTPIK